MYKEFFTWLYTTPPEGKSKTRCNGLLWHYCTKFKRKVPHETNNCKRKKATARNKPKCYVAALTPVDACSDTESVAFVDTWGSQIDEPPKKKTKRNKGKGQMTKKAANKRKIDNHQYLNTRWILIRFIKCLVTRICNRILCLVYLKILKELVKYIYFFKYHFTIY